MLQAQCLLDAFLFGPTRLPLPSSPLSPADQQRWLDGERASFLRRLLRCPEAGVSISTAEDVTTTTKTIMQDGCQQQVHNSDKIQDGGLDIKNNIGSSELYDLDDGSGVKIRKYITLEEKFQLMFLVRSNAKTLAQSLTLIKN